MNLKVILKSVVVVLLIIATLYSRFYHLGQTPSGVNIDEASYGYDAYSLLVTGKDQWGANYPLSLQSYGDYKPAGLSYAMIPFISVFGLSPLATRLPAAVSGLAITLLLYLLLQLLKPHKTLNFILALTLAFSPWAYGISRQFYEPSLALVFFLLALVLILASLKKPFTLKSQLMLGAMLGLSGYFYVAFRLSALLVLILYLLLLFFYRSRSALLRGLVSLGVFVALSLPLIPSTLFGASSTRLKQENSLRTYDAALTVQDNRQMCYLASSKNPLVTKLCYLLWNKPVLKFERMVKTVILITSPDYLFLNPHQKDIIPKGYGAYFFFLAPFYYLGFYALFKQLRARPTRPLSLFVGLTYLIVQLPGILIESPLIHRNLPGLFLAFIIISYGVHTFYDYLVHHNLRRKFTAVFAALSLILLVFYSLQYLAYYYSVFTKTMADMWNYDTYPVMTYVNQQRPHYQQVVFKGFEEPILYYAFVNQLDPETFHKSSQMSQPNASGWQHYLSLANLHTTDLGLTEYLCNYPADSPSTLYLTTPEPAYSPYADWVSYDFTQVHRLHEAYDLQQLTQKLRDNGINYLANCR